MFVQTIWSPNEGVIMHPWTCDCGIKGASFVLQTIMYDDIISKSECDELIADRVTTIFYEGCAAYVAITLFLTLLVLITHSYQSESRIIALEEKNNFREMQDHYPFARVM